MLVLVGLMGSPHSRSCPVNPSNCIAGLFSALTFLQGLQYRHPVENGAGEGARVMDVDPDSLLGRFGQLPDPLFRLLISSARFQCYRRPSNVSLIGA